MQACDTDVLRRIREDNKDDGMKNTASGWYYGNLSALMVPCVICQDKLPRGLDGGASK